MTERFWSPPLEQNGKILTRQDNEGKYGPDIMSDFVCDFIERNRDHPFFIYYPSVLVHDPFVPTPDNIGDAPRTQESNLAPENDEEQKAKATASREVYQRALSQAGQGTITTEIAALPEFYFAEEYHQQYLAKNPGGYCGLGGTGVSCPG